jgi:hypothetical protein
MIPGSNILAQAHRLIGFACFQYLAFKSRVTGATGLDVATYAKAVMVNGSVQPVPRRLYEYLGLDLQKNYYNVFAPNDIIDVERDISGDQIVYQGMKLQCESATRWFGIDGWNQILCVQVV